MGLFLVADDDLPCALAEVWFCQLQIVFDCVMFGISGGI